MVQIQFGFAMDCGDYICSKCKTRTVELKFELAKAANGEDCGWYVYWCKSCNSERSYREEVGANYSFNEIVQMI